MKRILGLILLVSVLSLAAFAYEDLRYGVAVLGTYAGNAEEQAAYRKGADAVWDFVDWELISVDVVDGDTLPLEVLDGYKVLIVTSLVGIDEELTAALVAVAEDGGKLIVAADTAEGVPAEFFDHFGFKVSTGCGTKAKFADANGIVEDKFNVNLNSTVSVLPEKDTKVIATLESEEHAVLLSDKALILA